MTALQDFQPSVRFPTYPALALSADGEQIAYTDDASGQFNLTVVAWNGGSPRTLTSYRDETVHEIAWHPDGESLIYLADSRGNEATQLHRINAAGQGHQQLTDSPGARYHAAFGDPFTRDGRFLAYCGNDRTAADQDVMVRDLTSGSVQRIYTGAAQAYAGHWSPDGAQLTVVVHREGNSDHLVYTVSVDGGEPTGLTPNDEVATYELGPWLPDGKSFLVITNAGREFAGLATMDATTGHLTWLDTPDWDVEAVALSSDGDRLLWLVNVDGVSQLRARSLRSGADVPTPRLPLGQISSLTISAEGSRAAIILSTPTQPTNIYAVDLDKATLRAVTFAAPIAADPATLIEPTSIRYPSRDGLNIPSDLFRPSDRFGRCPVVLYVHGGPVMQERRSYRNGPTFQYLLSRGVGVMAPNIRGSSGYGTSYQKLIYRDWGGGDLADLAAAVAYLRSLDWVDPDRIGLYGASYGGFAVLSCIARLPELNWAAAVDFYGMSNLVTLAENSQGTWRGIVEALIGNPVTDREFLRSRSPITYADHIQAPLFVVQGANDRRVRQHESDQIVESLRARGVEVRYDVYPDEGHSFTKRSNVLRAQAAAADFLIDHLILPPWSGT